MSSSPLLYEKHCFFERSYASPAPPSDKSRFDMGTSTKHFLNDTDRGKWKYSEISLSQCCFVHYIISYKSVLYIKIQICPHRDQSVAITMSNRRMLYRKAMYVYNHTESFKPLSELYVTPDLTI